MQGTEEAGTWTDRAAVTGRWAQRVLDYTDCVARTVEAAKQPDFTQAGWDELAALLDTETFIRVGNFKERQTWPEYRELLMQWATTTDFWSEFHRISQVDRHVFLQLTEHNTPRGGAESVVNSLTTYVFDEHDRLVRLGIYLQHD